MDLSVVILAAGLGKRMQSALPKVMHLIGGKPMLSHVLSTATALHPAQKIVVHGFGGDVLQQYFTQKDIIWAPQAQPLGTADAVAKALPFIKSAHQVLILYGDVPLISAQTLKNLIEITPKQGLGLLTAYPDATAGLGRIVRDKNKRMVEIIEERDADSEQLNIQETNTGILLVNQALLELFLRNSTNQNAQQEYYLTDIVAFCIKENRPVQTFLTTNASEVQGINDRHQQAQVERYYQRKQALHLMSQGVQLADPARLDVRGELQMEQDVFVDTNVIFEGKVFVGSGTQIGSNCFIKNCRIAPNVVIRPNSHLEDATLAQGVVIGPFARVRPGTHLSEHTHIGNFVEVKNSTIAARTKINHLSYIGDAQIGEDVNIGAGVITCNYDGAEKHQTIIEDDVHIGSDSQLVAPIRIGKGATLAAGSTLTDDAPAQQLTLTHRLERRSHSWQRPRKETKE